jgi:hypothetical protein
MDLNDTFDDSRELTPLGLSRLGGGAVEADAGVALDIAGAGAEVESIQFDTRQFMRDFLLMTFSPLATWAMVAFGHGQTMRNKVPLLQLPVCILYHSYNYQRAMPFRACCNLSTLGLGTRTRGYIFWRTRVSSRFGRSYALGPAFWNSCALT